MQPNWRKRCMWWCWWQHSCLHMWMGVRIAVHARKEHCDWLSIQFGSGKAKDMTDVYNELLKDNLFKEYHLQQRMIFIKWLWSYIIEGTMGIMICADRCRGYVKRKCLLLELTLVFFRFNCISLQLDNGTFQSFLATVCFQEMAHCKASMRLFCHDSATKTQRNRQVS